MAVARALTFRCARVPADRRPAYLAAVARAAARRAKAGAHFWLFRHAEDPGIFVEFREGIDPAAVEPTAEEAELDRLAEYLEDNAAVWLEVQPDASLPDTP